MKPFSPVSRQIEILIERNMKISDITKAKNFLLMNNYYNVVNMFGKFFMEKDGSNKYYNGTTFDEITAVHHFDEEIKGALFKTVSISESHLRATISYVFSENHNGKDDYLNQTCFDNSDLPQLNWLFGRLQKTLKKYNEDVTDNSIKHYQSKHGQVPLWVLINYIDFSLLKTFYKNMLMSEKNKVAFVFSNNLKFEYGMDDKLTPYDIDCFLDNIHEIRNILAHNNKLVGFCCINNPPYISQLHSKYGINPTDPRQNVFNTILLLVPFVSSNQFAILINTIIKRARNLSNNIRTISVNEVMISLGFGTDWYLSPKLKQGDKLSE